MQTLKYDVFKLTFLLEKELIRVEQQLELNKNKSHIKSFIEDKDSGYHFEKIDNANLTIKHNNI